MEKKFSPEKLSQINFLIKSILEKAHPPLGSGENICGITNSTPLPGTFRDFIQNMENNIKSMNDKHTSLSIKGYRNNQAAVFFYNGKNVSGPFHGSPIVPIEKTFGGGGYIALVSVNGNVGIFEIKSIVTPLGGKKYPDLATDGTEEESRSINNYYFKNEKNHYENFNLVLKNIESGETIQGLASFSEPPQFNSLRNFSHPAFHSDFPRMFGAVKGFECEKMMENSSDIFGACVTRKNKIYVWLNQWVENKNDNSISSLRKFLEAEHRQGNIILDIRGNDFGNPLVMIDFLCHFASREIIDEMEKIYVKTNIWPREFRFDNKIFKTEDLISKNLNNKLISVDQNWNVTDKDFNSMPNFLKKDYFEVFGLTRDECLNKGDDVIRNKKWVVVSNGREFSTSEHFLYFVSKSKNSNFLTLGLPTNGGSGFPINVNLEEFGVSLNLSTSRLYHRETNEMIIEGKGVRPHLIFNEDSKENFEKRAIGLLKFGPEAIGKYPSYILKIAEEM